MGNTAFDLCDDNQETKIKYRGRHRASATGPRQIFEPEKNLILNPEPGPDLEVSPETGPDLKVSPKTGPDPEVRVRAGLQCQALVGTVTSFFLRLG